MIGSLNNREEMVGRAVELIYFMAVVGVVIGGLSVVFLLCCGFIRESGNCWLLVGMQIYYLLRSALNM